MQDDGELLFSMLNASQPSDDIGAVGVCWPWWFFLLLAEQETGTGVHCS